MRWYWRKSAWISATTTMTNIQSLCVIRNDVELPFLWRVCIMHQYADTFLKIFNTFFLNGKKILPTPNQQLLFGSCQLIYLWMNAIPPHVQRSPKKGAKYSPCGLPMVWRIFWMTNLEWVLSHRGRHLIIWLAWITLVSGLNASIESLHMLDVHA